MKNTPNNITNALGSFIGLGIFIVLLICALIFFSYIFVIGATIGLVLFLIAYIRKRFFAPKVQKFVRDTSKHRIIDQDKD